MNLIALISQLIDELDDLIVAATDPLQQAQLRKLRDALDAMNDQAVHQLFDATSQQFTDACTALKSATAAATIATSDLTKVAGAINTAVAAANAVDKLVGFLAHLA